MKRMLISLAVAILFATSAFAKIIRVPADQPTIQAAINAAATGDTVLVVDGTYYENINFKGKAITVASHYWADGDTNHINNTIINGSRPSHPDSGSVVSFISGEDTTSILYGFTITNGTGTFVTGRVEGVDYAGKGGGGIICYNSGGSILFNKIVNNTIVETVGNVAAGGGIGAWLYDTTSHVDVIIQGNQILSNKVTGENASGAGINVVHNGKVLDNTISLNTCVGNQWAVGGGVSWISYFENEYTPSTYEILVANNQITHNSATSNNFRAKGGGMLVEGKASVLNNNISFNELRAPNIPKGAGIFMHLAGLKDTVLINGNTVLHNVIASGSGWGAGLCVQYADAVITYNNIFSFNINRNGWGGAMCFAEGSHAEVINNTATNNDAGYGGGLYSGSSASVVMNTILWNNQASSGSEIYRTGGLMTVVYSDVKGGWSGEGNIDADPVFADNAFRLADASPCIGKGVTSYNFGAVTLRAPATDLFGNPRPNPIGSRPDLGAVEHSRAFPKQSHLVEVPSDYSTIQAAINAAAKGDTVLVAEGTYYENISFKGKAITVASHYFMDGDTNHVNNTIIDGSRPSHPDSGSVVLFVSGEDTTSILYGFTITNGTGTVYTAVFAGTQRVGRVGGGISCGNSGGSILFNKINSNSVSQNSENAGGGISAGGSDYTHDSYVIIQGNRISSNTVTGAQAGGGGIQIFCDGRVSDNTISNNSCVANGYVVGGGIMCISDPNDPIPTQVIFSNNRITHNSAISHADLAYGSGVYVRGTNAFLLNNNISHNELSAASNAMGAGMMMWVVGGLSVVDGNTITHNVISRATSYGGGLCLFDRSKPLVTNNIISSNSATGLGGGICCRDNSGAEIINNTITKNAARYGGGLYSDGSSPVVMNTILWNNQTSDGAEIYRASGSLTVAYSDVKGGWNGTGNIDADPAFADTLFHLSNSSPCIDRGIDSLQVSGTWYYCPPFDIAGHVRPYPGTVADMGAYETDIITAVAAERSEMLPEHFALHQNYPNPFNPSTSIEFALPKPGFVTLKIYNTLGEEVATLVSEKLPAGKHQRVWEAKGLASGVYVYRLQAGEFEETKKLILLR